MCVSVCVCMCVYVCVCLCVCLCVCVCVGVCVGVCLGVCLCVCVCVCVCVHDVNSVCKISNCQTEVLYFDFLPVWTWYLLGELLSPNCPLAGTSF